MAPDAGAGRGPRRPRAPAPVPPLERHALSSPAADQGARRPGRRLRGRGRVLRRALARRAARRRRPLPPGARSARPHPPRDRRRPHGGAADAGDRARAEGGAGAQRARARARPARATRRSPAAGPAALQEPDRDPAPRARRRGCTVPRPDARSAKSSTPPCRSCAGWASTSARRSTATGARAEPPAPGTSRTGSAVTPVDASCACWQARSRRRRRPGPRRPPAEGAA